MLLGAQKGIEEVIRVEYSGQKKNAGLRIRGWGVRGHSVSTDLLCKRL